MGSFFQIPSQLLKIESNIQELVNLLVIRTPESYIWLTDLEHHKCRKRKDRRTATAAARVGEDKRNGNHRNKRKHPEKKLWVKMNKKYFVQRINTMAY